MVWNIFVTLDIKTRARRDEALSLAHFCPLVVRNTLDEVDPRKEKDHKESDFILRLLQV